MSMDHIARCLNGTWTLEGPKEAPSTVRWSISVVRVFPHYNHPGAQGRPPRASPRPARVVGACLSRSATKHRHWHNADLSLDLGVTSSGFVLVTYSITYILTLVPLPVSTSPPLNIPHTSDNTLRPPPLARRVPSTTATTTTRTPRRQRDHNLTTSRILAPIFCSMSCRIRMAL